MAMIALKADYIYSANTVFSNLQDYQEIFEIEANIIDYCKCLLVQGESLSDFYMCGQDILVYESSDGYDLYFDEYKLRLDVYDKQIVGFKLQKE